VWQEVTPSSVKLLDPSPVLTVQPYASAISCATCDQKLQKYSHVCSKTKPKKGGRRERDSGEVRNRGKVREKGTATCVRAL